MEKVEPVRREGGKTEDMNGQANLSEMQVYELGYHIVSTVAEENLPKEVEALKAIVLKDGGSLISEGEPKLINLAYPMVQSVADIKKEFTTAYFGWIKFETSSSLIREIKTAVDTNPSVLRYLLIKTVRESTLYTPKLNIRPADKEAGKSKRLVTTEEKKEVSMAEIDKSIDELLVE